MWRSELSYLIDTNVISEIRKGRKANAAVLDWFEENQDEGYFLSTLVVGEIRKGIERLGPVNAKGARRLDAWLAETCRLFDGRIIPVDIDVAEEWGRMSASDPPPVIDGLLAATAVTRGLTLATRNTADIERTGVSWVNPFG